jgi:simple sugar transport system permease protein
MSAVALPRGGARVSARRLGVAGLVLGVLAVLVTVPPLLVRSPVLPLVLALAAVALGIAALRQGERTWGGYAIFAGVAGAAVALVVQGAEEATVEAIVTASLFAATLRFATPLAFGALGGLFSERAGVVNIGLEGMMLTGAFFGILVCDKTDSWFLGVVGAAVCAGLMALVHAVFSIHLRADQIVSGTAINILALGITTFAFRSIYGSEGTPAVPRIPNVSVPGLRDIPFVGDIVGTMNLLIWVMLLLVVLSWVLLFKTPWGLRLRAVGEHPKAADTVGIDVFAVRYAGVVLSGVLAGLGGAILSFGLLGGFNENMTGGRGFIALAALIFGKWHPFGLLGATLLFGFATALGNSLQTTAGISANLVAMLPYALTLIALVGVVGRSTPPAAVGRPYQKQ